MNIAPLLPLSRSAGVTRAVGGRGQPGRYGHEASPGQCTRVGSLLALLETVELIGRATPSRRADRPAMLSLDRGWKPCFLRVRSRSSPDQPAGSDSGSHSGLPVRAPK